MTMKGALETEEVKSGYKKTKLGWIPEEWEERSLSELGTFLKGKGVPKKEILEEGLPCLTYGELYKHHHNVIQDFVSFIPEELAAYSQKLHYGDILFAGSGETLEEIGKSAAFVGHFPAFAGGDIIILRQSVCDPTFLGYLLNQDDARRQLNRLGQGHSVVHIYSSGLGTLKIPIPPLPEQRAIARILSTWDKAIQTLQKLIEKKEERKKGLMQVLLSGEVRLEAFSGEWRVNRLEQISQIDAESLSSQTPKGFRFKYVSLSNAEKGNIIGELAELTFQEAPSRARRRVKTGDILMSTVRPNLQGFVHLENEVDDLVASTGFAVITPNEDISGRFIFHYLFGRNLSAQLHGLLVGSNYPAINSKDVRKLKIKLPSFKEQQKIASVLSAADQEIERLKDQLTKLDEQKKGLMQKLLTGEVRVSEELKNGQ